MVRNSIYRVIIFVFVIIASCNLCHAQEDNSEDSLAKGLEAFQNLDFEKAILYLKPFESNIEELDDDAKITLSYILGTCYHLTGNLEKALSLYNIVLKSASLDNNINLQLHPTMLSISSELGDENATREYLSKMLGMMDNPSFKQSGFYSDYAIGVCTYYQTKKQYEKVLEYAQKGINVIDLEENEERLKGVQKNTLYMSLGNANRELANYEMAADNYKYALQYISYTEQNLSDALSVIGNCYEHANLSDSALIYLEEAEKLYTERNAPLNNSRVTNSLELGVVYGNRGESKRAIYYLQAAENGYKELEDFTYLPYVYSHLYNNSKSIGDKELTNKYAKLIKDYIKYTKNDNSREYNICYSTYASILESEGKSDEAISIMRNLTIAESLNDETPTNGLATSYYKQASLDIKTGDYIKAEINVRKALDLLDSIKDRNKGLYIWAQLLLSEALEKTGRIGEAISNLENLNEFIFTAKGYDDAVSQYYSIISGLYARIGNNEKILEYDLIASEIQLKNTGNESYDYAISLINLSEAYALNQQSDMANECLTQAANIIKKLYGDESKEYYVVFHKQVLKYTFDSSNINEGEKAYRKCLQLAEKCFGLNSIEYGEDLCWYATFKFYSTRDRQSLELMQKGLDILSAHEGYEDNILNHLSQISAWCHVLKDYELAYSYDKQYYNRVKKHLSINLPKLVDWQRESLWTPIHNNLSRIIAAASETNSSLYLKLAYNSMLLGKGLLLQSSNNITSAIKQGGDTELNEIHNQIQIEKAKLLKSADQKEIELIRGNINSLQRKELNKLANSDVLNGLLDIEWTDVRDDLNDGEVAIEFVSFPTQDCQSYAALVINSHCSEPLCIPLFNDKELLRFIVDENVEYDYKNPELYRVIWDRLETYALRDAKNVYFAPDGLLHKIAIESLVDKNGQIASDKWNLHRLTSTREIVTASPSPEGSYKSAVLYGGLTYSMDSEDLEEAAKLRAGAKNLAETKVEIADIQTILEDKSVKCQLKTGEMGTEESFMALSSTGVNILHLATHGFFWTKENEDEYSNVQFMTLINSSDNKESALLRSGLLLTGANIALQGKNNSNVIQDGILTAQEIASLDFEGLDLVVLSACQTALGEISGEGVFGLQRGFKLAGANSMLMSLWKVDDTATRLLMTEFYNQMLHGNSKSEALRNTQQKIRSVKGFEDPEYWAGFILLDGIN